MPSPNGMYQAVPSRTMSIRFLPPITLLLCLALLLPAPGGAWEIRLTDSGAAQQNPAISGSTVVWEDDRNGNWDIYLWDGMTGETRRLTDDTYDQRYPQIAGRLVVWEDLRNSEVQMENPDIYLYDLITGAEMMVNSPDSLWGGYERRPAISTDSGKPVVVWYDSANGLSECGRVFFRYIDGVSGPRQVYQDSNTQTSPWVSGEQVAWTDQDLGGIYFRYLREDPTIVLERMSNETITGIRSSGNRIVWSQFSQDSMEFNIRLCELDPTMTPRVLRWLSPFDSFQSDPSIDGDLVVWRDERPAAGGGGGDLYRYDFRTGETAPLVVAYGLQYQPALDGGLVAFTDTRWGNPEIYLVPVDDGVPLPGVVEVPGGTGVPTDPDGEGRCPDVNGNGRRDFADIVLYFNQMGWITANEPVFLFDFNGNGRIDFADVVALFNGL